jgi:hypothetical protein
MLATGRTNEEGEEVKGTDKLLIGIVLGAVLLVAVTLAVVLLRPEATYQSDDTPEGVAHNYLLALEKEEHERAYGYLSDSLPGYPADVEAFEESIDRNSWRFRKEVDSSVAILSVEISGSKAVVTVRETRFYHYGLFHSSQNISTFEITLQQRQGQWRIIDAEAYFAWCWRNDVGCSY